MPRRAQRAARALVDAADAGRTILAPNTELAAALFDHVERQHVQSGHAIWPTPQIRDFGGWLREQHVQRQFSDASLPRVLSDLEERELWRWVVLESEAGKEFLEPAGAARAARRARRAMAEYGIPTQALAEYGTEEALALLEWNRRFDRRCAQLHAVSFEQLLESLPEVRQVEWIESPAWRPVARRWLQTHGAAMPAPGCDAGVSDRFQAVSPAAEFAAIAEWARDHRRANPNFRAWVCIPDLSLRRAQVHDAFDAVLAPQRFSLAAHETPAPYAVAGGTPLSDFAPVRAALDALSAAAGPVSFETFSALLRMPALQPSPAEASAAALLDLKLRHRGADAATLDEWLHTAEGLLREGTPGASTAVQRLRGFLRTLGVRGTHPLSRWVSVWVDALEAGPWAERQRWSSTEFQAAERFRELLAALAIADDMFGARSAESAGRLLRRAARDTAFQPQTGIPPIWISGQLMDPWLSYDGVWVAGCNEDRWPPPLDPIPLLPVRLQREYNVVPAGIESQLQFAEELQRRWLSRAHWSVFSGADPGDGRAAAFSPLLPPASPQMPIGQTRTWPGPTAPVPLTQPHWQVQVAHAPVLESVLDEQGPVFASPERTRGVSTLRAQSQCAFRGFAQTRLMTDPLDRPMPGFNARERGEMLHDALEQLWRDLRTWAQLHAMTPQVRDPLVTQCAARAIAKQCERRDPGVRWRRRELPRLSALLGKWLDTEVLREPFEVEQLEHAAQTAHHGGLEFRVRIDRVDRLADGGRVLIDYKTGMALPDWRGDRPDNPQLPIYALLRPAAVVAVAYGRVNASDCGFVAETERASVFKARGRPTHLEGRPNFAALIATWSQRIERIALEFGAGNAQVAPTLRACASCRLQPLCRIPSALEAGRRDE